MTTLLDFGSGKVLITNDGKHSAEALAKLIPDNIIQIMSTASEATLKEAFAFTKELETYLTKVITELQAKEQANIATGAHGTDADSCHLLGYNCEAEVKKSVQDIVDFSSKYSFKAHFAQDLVRKHLGDVLNNHFASAMHVERHHFHTSKGQ